MSPQQIAILFFGALFLLIGIWIGWECWGRSRRECRDVIAGNVQFHTDPYAAPKPVAPADPDDWEDCDA